MRAPALGALMLAAMVGVPPGQPARAQSEDAESFVRIGTGSTGGTYFAVGTLIANAISNPPGARPCEKGGPCGVPGLIAVAQATKGSVDNVESLLRGDLELGLAQTDVAHYALTATGPFKGRPKATGLAAIAYLYPEQIHLVVRRGARIKSLKDLRGKALSIDTAGSGTQVLARLALESFGLAGKVKTRSLDPFAASDQLAEGHLDGFFFVAGAPSRLVTLLAEDRLIDLLPIDGAAAQALRKRHAFLSVSSIPRGIYPELGAVATVSVGALLLVSAQAGSERVEAITRALWHPRNLALFERGHPAARAIRPETAARDLPLPLHPGAAHYYKEAAAPNPDLAQPATAPLKP